tara:strand:- start:3113 stop:3982 length:870 start_codon:yes stop_codon:yes gene_type:complete
MPSHRRPKKSRRGRGLRTRDLKPVGDILKIGVGKGVERGSKALEYLAEQAEPYLKQGANMDILMAYNGLLIDIRSFFRKHDIKSVLKDDIFYVSISDLVESYGADINRYNELVRNTLKASRVHIQSFIDEIRETLMGSSDLDKSKMDELLQILYREMIEDVGGSIDLEPKDKIPDSKGKGFKKVVEKQKLKDLNADINRRIEEIKNLKRMKSATGLSPSGKYDLNLKIDILIRELSEIIRMPGVLQNYADKAFIEIPELAEHFMDIAEPEPEPEMGRKKKKRTNRRKKK